MSDRRAQELTLIESIFGPTIHDDSITYVLFERYELPSGWNRAHTRLLFNVPPAYPEIPPDCFYVSTGLLLANGNQPTNYSEGANFLGTTWGQFSLHPVVEDWNPMPDPKDGHNLLTFMVVVRKRLEELN